MHEDGPSRVSHELSERVSAELPLAVRLERIRKADHKPIPFELLTQKERNAILNVSLSILMVTLLIVLAAVQ